MRFFVVSLKAIKITLVVCLIAIFFMFNMSGVNQCMGQVYLNKNIKKVPIYSVKTESKKVAISFDAAWGADKTKDIMSILKKYNANATFFLVGFWIDKYPELVEEIDKQGFEVGSHSNTHPDFTKLSKDQMTLELTTTNDKIKSLTGKSPSVFRFPFGAYNNASIDVVESLGLKAIQWDIDSLDWKGIPASQICKNVLTKVKNGSIILCHNNSDHIVEALPTILSTLTERGFEITCVSNLIYKENYCINSQGIQIKNGE
jgi:polysaccharide deacetylase family sporulation protein PdaB